MWFLLLTLIGVFVALVIVVGFWSLITAVFVGAVIGSFLGIWLSS